MNLQKKINNSEFAQRINKVILNRLSSLMVSSNSVCVRNKIKCTELEIQYSVRLYYNPKSNKRNGSKN
jgi:hypothetical protein